MQVKQSMTEDTQGWETAVNVRADEGMNRYIMERCCSELQVIDCSDHWVPCSDQGSIIASVLFQINQ